MRRQLLILAQMSLATVAVGQTPVVSVKNLMTVSEFNTAGLNKLSTGELNALDQWFVKTLIKFSQRSTVAGGGSGAVPGTYPVEASVNDETFIINGEVFKAQTYCFNVNKGDRVKCATGACASAKFINMRTGQVCEVWCE